MLWIILVASVPRTTLLFALALWTVRASQEGPSIAFSNATGNQTSVLRWCTVDELLPRPLRKGERISPEWSTELVEPPYGCDCSFFRGRYFCPHLGKNGNHRAWVPQAVASGSCKSVERTDLSQAPLPPSFKVLVYGNSHLRQVVEGLMCMFHETVESKRVRFHNKNGGVRTIPGETVCRDSWGDVVLGALLDHSCISDDDVTEGCLCTDDHGEFTFENGATLHYFYAGASRNTVSLADALPPHGNVSLSWYNAVFANSGNGKGLTAEAVLAASAELQEASVPFFWLNTYKGKGEVGKWKESQRSCFQNSGAKHVKIDVMTHGMFNLTKENVESDIPRDPHFCLPGPPDEMAVLLAKMMWAVHFEANE